MVGSILEFIGSSFYIKKTFFIKKRSMERFIDSLTILWQEIYSLEACLTFESTFPVLLWLRDLLWKHELRHYPECCKDKGNIPMLVWQKFN